ncbi:hypothetical protein B484DRAFT_415489 [Ochromonadaceae sp. CCMP2298]|nr:hypothetical protein B484DRAFT_415489 [Ochromonadaceae sp. CCMP2298]
MSHSDPVSYKHAVKYLGQYLAEEAFFKPARAIIQSCRAFDAAQRLLRSKNKKRKRGGCATEELGVEEEAASELGVEVEVDQEEEEEEEELGEYEYQDGGDAEEEAVYLEEAKLRLRLAHQPQGPAPELLVIQARRDNKAEELRSKKAALTTKKSDKIVEQRTDLAAFQKEDDCS